MSVVNSRNEKILLPRSGADGFWRTVMDHYAGTDTLRWKYLAMLALRENSGWPLDTIGLVFEHPRGHVSRCLKKVKAELSEQFNADGFDE